MIAYDNGDARERTVTAYRYLCRRAAKKFYRPGLDRADLEQIGAIGLIKAYDRYDPRTTTPFEAYAWLIIIGELMHYVRDYERAMRPPRRLRALDKRVHAAYESLAGELGAEPSRLQIAARLDVPPQDVEDVWLYRQHAIPASFEALHPHEFAPHAYTIEDCDDALLLQAALSRLSDVERTIVLAIYSDGYTQSELARRLGYSRRHISRLHRGALKKMQPVWVARSA